MSDVGGENAALETHSLEMPRHLMAFRLLFIILPFKLVLKKCASEEREIWRERLIYIDI